MSDPNTSAVPVTTVVDDKSKPYKAYAGGVLTGLGVFAAAWIGDDDPFTKKEFVTALVSSVAATVPAFGIVFTITNPKVLKRRA